MDKTVRDPDMPHNETSDISKARLRAWLQVLRVSRKIEGELREKMRLEFGSTLPRFDVMAALYRSRDGMRMSELSSALMVSNGNVTGIVDRLVTEGMLVRVPVENDRRASIVRLTEAGEKDFAERALVHEGWVSELFSDLSASDADTLIRILRTVYHHNEAHHD
ncbi:MarR family winged helix-turn-helix transcriptional regulator [Thalassospira xiamenensis]|uniref:MarR family winged helix-turn-helix transcriptional regulator n=1 Tax=Thalassospira xiamenensis TaxID=220697 RepID=UPI001FFF6190|nr:MarR family transcriptional regulator [Thalassospira xiamenensis]MCK2169224.1 MarR family transcriptional regulator [Thalassospira xiamenensis]